MSLEIISGALAKSSRKTMRKRGPPLQNSKKGHQKWAASPPILRAGFRVLEGWTAFSHSFSQGFRKGIANYFQRQYQNEWERRHIVICGRSGGTPCTQAGVLVKFAKNSRAHAKNTTTTASVHGGAPSAPPCSQAVHVIPK